MKLYTHQLDLLGQLSASYKHGHESVVIQAPTGLGKSVIAGYLADKLHQAGKKVLFLVHLKELIEQLGKTCQRSLSLLVILRLDYLKTLKLTFRLGVHKLS